VPTVAESSGPAGFEVAGPGSSRRAGRPKRWTASVRTSRRCSPRREVCERFAAFGYDAFPQSSAEMAATIEADRKRYGEVINRLNLSLD
jgi:hypothetical protein